MAKEYTNSREPLEFGDGVTVETVNGIDELTRPIIGIENRTAQEVFDIMSDRFRRLSASGAGRVSEQALRDLLDYVDRNTCTHEEVTRGGLIWTICSSCGEKWADDRGGFVPHQDAPEVAAARAAVSFLEPLVSHEGAEGDEVETDEQFRAGIEEMRRRAAPYLDGVDLEIASPTPQPEPEVVAWLHRRTSSQSWDVSNDGPQVRGWKAAYDIDVEPLIRQSDHLSLVSQLREESARLQREIMTADGLTLDAGARIVTLEQALTNALAAGLPEEVASDIRLALKETRS